jgi:Viral BACON domain
MPDPGGGTLSWSANDNATWLTLSPTSGTGNGAVTLSATGATAVTVPVTFTVKAAAALTVSPSSLSFAATQGAANPASQSMTASSNGTWTVSKDASWLTVSPTSGSNNGTITASVNTANVTLGTNNATITVTGGGITQTVTVVLTLNAPATSSATLTWTANTESDLAGYKVYRATASGGYGAPIATLQGNITSYIASGLQSGTTYFFVITTYDTFGNESPYSNEVTKSIF